VLLVRNVVLNRDFAESMDILQHPPYCEVERIIQIANNIMRSDYSNEQEYRELV
jgi:hypothetical protein